MHVLLYKKMSKCFPKCWTIEVVVFKGVFVVVLTTQLYITLDIKEKIKVSW